jgi:HSP20 family protein
MEQLFTYFKRRSDMYGSLRTPRNFQAEFERWQRQFDRASPQARNTDSIRAVAYGEFPQVNVGSTADTVEIVAFAPGIDPKSVQLTVDKGLLIIAGARVTVVPADNDQTTVYARERPAGSFRRVISLPEDSDPGQVDATYKDGVLRVTIGKRESSKPRHIEIKS